MRSLRKLLGLEDAGDRSASEADSDIVHRLARELDRLDHDEARYLACFSYVLARVANADLDVSPEEVTRMEQLVQSWGGLEPAQAALVVQMAKGRAVTLGGTDDYLVTRQFRDLSTREQRLGLLRCLFAVAAADDDISTVENARISQIATELGLTAPEVTAVRSSYRKSLSVLKDLPGKDKGSSSEG